MGVVSLGEARLGNGQVVSFSCPSGQKEATQAFLSSVESITFPRTRAVSHGGYGRYSRYQIKQHEYAGGHGGYIELLEIEDAPDGRANIVIYHYEVSGVSLFTEWDSLENARKAYEKFWSTRNIREKFPKFRGFERLVECAANNPWFYAVDDDGLIGDHYIPYGLSDDPVYRIGRKFLVEDESGGVLIKTCLGCRFYKGSRVYGRQDREVELRLVYWDDGSVSRREVNETNVPRPLETGEEWIEEAVAQFKQLLTGKISSFTINFLTGGSFTGRLKTVGKIQRGTRAGDYELSVSIEGEKKSRTGWVKGFVPSSKEPNIIQHVSNKFGKHSKKIARIKIKRFKPASGSTKRWEGVFLKPPAQ